MGFIGETYAIPCDRGGLSGHPNLDLAPPTAMLYPSRNINLHEGGRGKRGGTAHVNATALTDTPTINGIYDFWLKDGTQYVMLGTNDGKIWKNATTTIKTGWQADQYPGFEVFDNYLYVGNGYNTPFYWDGTTVTNMTQIPSDWSGTNFPAQFIKHGYGNSERLWAIGCLGSSTTGYRVYASADGDATDFSNANVITLELNTADPGGIIGGVEYGDRLIVFSRQHAFVINDTDASTANWGYYQAQWFGGAANWRCICKTPTDIIAMMEDGEIYSVTAAENYGDYKQASLVRPSFMHTYIQDRIKLSSIAQFHMVYDPTLRAVKVFVVRNGKTQVDTALVYYIDRELSEAWSIHDNQAANSGYKAASSALVRVGVGNYQVYTGDYAGFVWNLEQSNRNDNNAAYYGGFKTVPVNCENARVTKRFTNGRLIHTPKGDYDMQVKWWVDGVAQTATSVSMGGVGVPLGTFLLGTDSLMEGEVADSFFALGAEGKRIQYEFYNSTVNQDFFVSQVLTDFVPIGAKP